MLKSLSILIPCLFGFFHLTNCKIPYPDSCPDIKVIETFDLDRYMGTWHHYAKYASVPEETHKCKTEVWENKGNDTVSWVYHYVLNNKPNKVRGVGRVIEPGQLSVAVGNPIPETPNYFILGTDYDNWAVVYRCVVNGSTGHIRYLWIMTRELQPSEGSIAATQLIMKDNKLSEDFLIILKHPTNCPDIHNNTYDKQRTGCCSIL